MVYMSDPEDFSSEPHPWTCNNLSNPPEIEKEEKEVEEEIKSPSLASQVIKIFVLGLAAVGMLYVGTNVPDSFLSHFTVFVLACFVGWQVVWNVKPALHTPLMSVTNAISGIIIIGGILQLSRPEISATVILGAAAVLLAAINVAGGFLVTNRMLAMFRR